MPWIYIVLCQLAVVGRHQLQDYCFQGSEFIVIALSTSTTSSCSSNNTTTATASTRRYWCITKAIGASQQLRSKKELIGEFISGVNAETDVEQSWREYIQRKKEQDLEELIASENLKPKETANFIESSFRDGVVRTTGTEIDKILPPMSRFGGGGGRQEKRKAVIEKIQAFFEKYAGL